MAAMLPLLGSRHGDRRLAARRRRYAFSADDLVPRADRRALRVGGDLCPFHLPVVWVYSSIIGDYMLKGSLLIWRFKSGRWKHVLAKRLVAVEG